MALETKRLIIRTLHEEDFQDFLEYALDAELCKMLGWREMHNEAEARKHFDRLLQSKTYLGIYHKMDKKIIGNIGLGNVMHIPSLALALEADPEMKDKRGCALSFALSTAYRRQGIMTEALVGVMDLLFQNDKFDYFNCGYLVFNEPSRLLQEKLGFRYYCTHQFGRIPDGPDIVENILLKDDFYRLNK